MRTTTVRQMADNSVLLLGNADHNCPPNGEQQRPTFRQYYLSYFWQCGPQLSAIWQTTSSYFKVMQTTTIRQMANKSVLLLGNADHNCPPFGGQQRPTFS